MKLLLSYVRYKVLSLGHQCVSCCVKCLHPHSTADVDHAQANSLPLQQTQLI